MNLKYFFQQVTCFRECSLLSASGFMLLVFLARRIFIRAASTIEDIRRQLSKRIAIEGISPYQELYKLEASSGTQVLASRTGVDPCRREEKRPM